MPRSRELAELATSYDSGGSLGFRNRIINGAMVIDQRNAGAVVTLDAAGNVTYGMDRFWAADDTDGVVTLQQITDAPSGFTNSARITITTADASLSASQYLVFSQRVEGFNVADFAFGSASAATVTLSFWVKSSLTGTFGGSLRNSAGNRSYPFTYSISAANTWEQKSITIAGDTTGTWVTNNGIGLNIFWGLGVGSSFSGTAGSWSGSNFLSATGAVSVVGTLNATWQITGVQLEKGSTATSFDYRPYGTELQLCQRYYETGAATYFSGQVSGSVLGVSYKVTKRAAATLAATGTFYSGAEATGRNLGSGGTQVTQAFYFESTSNWAGGTWTASAEL